MKAYDITKLTAKPKRDIKSDIKSFLLHLPLFAIGSAAVTPYIDLLGVGKSAHFMNETNC